MSLSGAPGPCSSQGVKRSSRGTIKKPPVESTGWCYTRCKEDISYSFAWTIEGFRRKMETFSNGQCLTSHDFKVVVNGKETAWKLECFPNGKQKLGEDTVGAVSVFLYPMNQNSINRNFSFAIGFVNGDNSRVMKGKGDHCFRDNQNGWGWLKLVTHQTLRGEGREGTRPEGEKLLPNDSLNILCVMKFRGEDVTSSGSARPANISTNSGSDDEEEEEKGQGDGTGANNFIDLLHSGELSDIEVKCEGEVFKCHSAILAGKSEVFRAMLVHNMREKATRQINLIDVEADTFKVVLEYCYEGKYSDSVQEKAARILRVAEQYSLLQLKRRCERELKKSLAIANCLDYLILADLYNAEILRPFVMKFVVENAQELTELPQWKEMMPVYPQLFTEIFSEVAGQKPAKRAKGDGVWSNQQHKFGPASKVTSLTF